MHGATIKIIVLDLHCSKSELIARSVNCPEEVLVAYLIHLFPSNPEINVTVMVFVVCVIVSSS